ncbi:nucleotidyltransferase domain-containing protein [Erysipelatoclostridium ramosum]|uniref:SMODS domain-containing nucleotidyltransferase n=1 Tax=Thomasclavelia ramosa TaxID=1547 RepID=UPI001D066922|nr:nucleotidyltransferase domain-containing protein [Thomasclavelia ramosa]MCB6452249.1 nucleotidyltransferase domain-containing protein [Thomasclavelia ramosa]MCB7265897.1 nucleotidyltransferase domain-containing protein [Thomasclavelia ramosa]MCB7428021.1 nucleotidyltransferase domain-containing protein [Thomasclavelia ramosa]
MSDISVSQDFTTLCKNLRMSDYIVKDVQTCYHAITKRINKDFWFTDSETSHSFYVGSYGRGTAIYTSDIDIVVELPWSEYTKYDNYTGNGQSALLQSVKSSLQKTYSSSSISGDGQVVVIDFSNGIKFEIVPSFKLNDGTYTYPDTHNGGSWKYMNPKEEMNYFNGRNSLSNNNLKRLCRMARAWNSNMTVLMSGILIDTIAYRFMQNYEYADKSYSYYDWLSRDFFKYLYENADKEYWVKFGDNKHITKKYSFKSESKKAYELALAAIDAYDKGYSYTWHNKWREIYGTKFPI